MHESLYVTEDFLLKFQRKIKKINKIPGPVFHCSPWMNGSLHCGYSEPSAVPFYWQNSDYWSWCHAMVIHSEMALWQLWSSFDSSNCSPSRVKMGLSLALSNNKKHLVGILMNKKLHGKMRPAPRHAFDKLAVCHFDYLNSPLRSYEIWGKLSSDIPLAAIGDVTVCVFVQ